MPIVQISRIQHRRGKRTDLPQLAAGELGWVVDEQRLFIGNGTVADGAPAVGNTEIVTDGSSAFTTALSHTYKGYLGDSTPVGTSQQRTLQQRLDDYVSVKDFGAKGDNSTADVTAIQNAIKNPPYNKVLDITFDPIVSSDVVGNSHSGIIDGLATMEINKNKIKILVWFDNGWGYSARLIDTINKLSESSLNE